MKHETNQYRLCGKITVANYREYRDNRNREKVAILIKRRFTERYLDPVSSGKKNGFAIMAICCLAIEALESFYQGWENTYPPKSKYAFRKFFEREKDFSLFFPWSDDFYHHIRCGILHQAETRDGWRIRNGILLDLPKKSINASHFLEALKGSLKAYCKKLKESDWNSELWKNAIRKLDAICNNCETKDRE